MNCSLCGKESVWTVCEECVKDHNSPRTMAVWENNRETAEKLAQAYYKHALAAYGKEKIRKDSKENLGFNAFCDGINMGLDIITPFLDENQAKAVQKQISQMLELRKQNKKYK
jgi:hypothetical protein